MERSQCTIYRVHKHLRNVNMKAYEPEVIAIGPYHRSKDNLQMMEDHKLCYLRLILERKEINNIETYVSAIEPLEEEARKCYAEPITLNSPDFLEMLILDGCFIIDLRDLILFENQVPFFILCKLFDLIEVPNEHSRLIYLLLIFFNSIFPGNINRNNFREDEDNERRRWRFINNATELREANVKFKRTEGVSLFDLRFEDGNMLLSPLTIEDRTESLFRNLVAYEQYFGDGQTNYVTDYVKFLDCLIDSSRDVAILSRHGIIDNWLGDDEVVANMFNKLTDSVAGPGTHFVYANIFHVVNKHCNGRRNRWMAKLRRNYLNSPWAVISVLFAVLLLLLTVTQTVCSILQVV
ncbi:hypothetical protein MIMGU_mgv1a019478mg [Erythranthe guttata]|uniref:Uncharacterized protein n=1 Tax=Erythranthe guttata TaxID=4155 RepID=A0A022Q8C9_ERYGU|nr:hypothetical protein MIMGU_mgv1a019478mg [Erythranthe guttata]